MLNVQVKDEEVIDLGVGGHWSLPLDLSSDRQSFFHHKLELQESIRLLVFPFLL